MKLESRKTGLYFKISEKTTDSETRITFSKHTYIFSSNASTEKYTYFLISCNFIILSCVMCLIRGGPSCEWIKKYMQVICRRLLLITYKKLCDLDNHCWSRYSCSLKIILPGYLLWSFYIYGTLHVILTDVVIPYLFRICHKRYILRTWKEDWYGAWGRWLNEGISNYDFLNQIIWTDKTCFTNCSLFNRNNEYIRAAEFSIRFFSKPI